MVTIINPPTLPAKTPASSNGNGHRPHSGAPRGTGGGNNGGGGGDNYGGDDSEWDDVYAASEGSRFRIGMVVLLVTIVMMFASLTIAYMVLSTRPNWQVIALPAQLWISTAFIIASSIAFEMARRSWKRERFKASQKWMITTVALGAWFVVSQVLAWRELAAQGIYRQTNPYRSFIFLLTGIHAIHLLAGIAGIAYLTWRVRHHFASNTNSANANNAAIDAGVMYWHFIDGLWVYVFMLLLLWR